MADAPSHVETPRLVLRPWRASDAAELQRVVLANVAHIGAWMEWATPEAHADLDAIAERLEGFAREFASGADWVYALFDRDTGALLGAIGVHPRIGPGGIEIGYWLRADATGRGLMTEAVRAALALAFDALGAERVEIRCDPRNVRSAAVPRRLGFRHASTRPGLATTPGGEPRETMIWELRVSERAAAGA